MDKISSYNIAVADEPITRVQGLGVKLNHIGVLMEAGTANAVDYVPLNFCVGWQGV